MPLCMLRGGIFLLHIRRFLSFDIDIFLKIVYNKMSYSMNDRSPSLAEEFDKGTDMSKLKLKFSKVYMLHYFKLIYRSLLFLVALITYICSKFMPDTVNLIWGYSVPLLCVIWLVYFVEMVLRFFPSKYESMGCQKQFTRNYSPREGTVGIPDRQPWQRTLLVFGSCFYGLDPQKKHIFIVGGSLGSGTLNNAMKKWICDGRPGGENVEVIWQCGKYYKPEIDAFMKEKGAEGVQHSDFIKRMDLAYAAADVVISRSGASSVSELCAAHKAVIFVPSPNVAEDHQTHNAMALVNRSAAMMVKDTDAADILMSEACRLVNDKERVSALERNIAALAKTEAALEIAEEVYRIIG